MPLAANPLFFPSIIYIIVLLNADKTLFLISVDTTQACCTDRLGFLSHIPVHLLSTLTCPSLGPSLGPSLVNSCLPSVPGWSGVCDVFTTVTMTNFDVRPPLLHVLYLSYLWSNNFPTSSILSLGICPEGFQDGWKMFRNVSTCGGRGTN